MLLLIVCGKFIDLQNCCRYFSRKYPIQLIIKNISSNPNPESLQDEARPNGKGEIDSSPTKERKSDSNVATNLSHQSSNESVTATDDKSDLGSIILQSDVSITCLLKSSVYSSSLFPLSSYKYSKTSSTRSSKPPNFNPCLVAMILGFCYLLDVIARKRTGFDDLLQPVLVLSLIRSFNFPTWLW